MRTTKSTKPAIKRISAAIAFLGMLIMSSGLALMVGAAPAGASPSGVQHGCDNSGKVTTKQRGDCGGDDCNGDWKGNDKVSSKGRGGCDDGCDGDGGPWKGNSKVSSKGRGGCDDGCDGPVILEKGKPGKHDCDPGPECGNDQPPSIIGKKHKGDDVECVVPTDPGFVDPTCDTDPQVILPSDPPVEEQGSKLAAGPVVLTSDAGGVHYVATGDLEPGGTVEVDATAIDPAVIQEGAQVHWEHTFTTPEGCDTVEPPVVEPPVVEPPVVEPAVVVAPTVVHAGLIGTVAKVDPRGEQGRILMGLGVLMLVLAGGLGLRPSSANRR